MMQKKRKNTFPLSTKQKKGKQKRNIFQRYCKQRPFLSVLPGWIPCMVVLGLFRKEIIKAPILSLHDENWQPPPSIVGFSHTASLFLAYFSSSFHSWCSSASSSLVSLLMVCCSSFLSWFILSMSAAEYFWLSKMCRSRAFSCFIASTSISKFTKYLWNGHKIPAYIHKPYLCILWVNKKIIIYHYSSVQRAIRQKKKEIFISNPFWKVYL